MDKINFSLTSKGYKFIGVITSIVLFIFLIVLIANFHEIPLYAIIYVFFVFLFALFGCVLCFTHRIFICEKEGCFVVANLIKKKILLKEIIDIKVNNSYSIAPKKFCYIDIFLEDGRIIKIVGYSSLLKKNNIEKTKKIVEEIRKIAKILNN